MATSVWKGHLAFGLVSLPVKMTCAARSESISFCQLRKGDHSRIGIQQIAKDDEQPVAKDDILKGFEIAKGKYVIVTPEEIAAAAPESAENAEILEFVPVAEVDPFLFEQSYFLAPDVGGDKPYALLYEGLKKNAVLGIAKITMHNREHVLALRAGHSGITAHTMFYAHEARAKDEHHADTSKITAQESELAGMLINTLATSFDLNKFEDTYRINLLALIEAKGAGLEVPELVKKQVQSATPNLLDALKASLATKGPVAVPSPTPIAAPAAKPGAAPRKRKVAA